MRYRYKNTSKLPLDVIEVGHFEPEETKELDRVVENPNLELVISESKPSKSRKEK